MKFKKIQYSLFSVIILTAIGIIQNNISAEELSLTDIKWTSANHGDVTTSKTVQINQPFTAGNEGRDNKISLLTTEGSVEEFE